MSRRAVFATDENLLHFKCTKSSSKTPSTAGHDTPESLLYKDWEFYSFHCKMLDSKELCKIAAEISSVVGGKLSSEDHIHVSNHTLRLPAMIFGNDAMSLKFHPTVTISDSTSGDRSHRAEKSEHGNAIRNSNVLTLSINAGDALSCWAAQHSASNESITPLTIVQVPCAKSWNERSVVPADVADDNHSIVGKDEKATGSACTRNLWDWTFTSDYCCTLSETLNANSPSSNLNSESVLLTEKSTEMNASKIISGRAISGGSPPLSRNIRKDVITHYASDFSNRLWQRSAVSGIDLDLLRMKNVPILFFDEILLYQDDLEDCGDVIFDAKLRVMPSCWFILSRFFVRVDGAIIRIRDTRLFHRFGDKAVHMEISWREYNLSADQGKDAIDQLLSNTELLNPAACAEKIALVNDREGIHRFYSLQL
jgi:TIP41-like family